MITKLGDLRMSQNDSDNVSEFDSVIQRLEILLLELRSRMVTEMVSAKETMNAVDEVLKTQNREMKFFKIKSYLTILNPFAHKGVGEIEKEYILLAERNSLTMKAAGSMESAHAESLRELLAQSLETQELIAKVKERKALLED